MEPVSVNMYCRNQPGHGTIGSVKSACLLQKFKPNKSNVPKKIAFCHAHLIYPWGPSRQDGNQRRLRFQEVSGQPNAWRSPTSSFQDLNIKQSQLLNIHKHHIYDKMGLASFLAIWQDPQNHTTVTITKKNLQKQRFSTK